MRQVFNDTDADALWLVVGAPPEVANTLEMSEETLAFMYPDGPKALPPELERLGVQLERGRRSSSPRRPRGGRRSPRRCPPAEVNVLNGLSGFSSRIRGVRIALTTMMFAVAPDSASESARASVHDSAAALAAP